MANIPSGYPRPWRNVRSRRGSGAIRTEIVDRENNPVLQTYGETIAEADALALALCDLVNGLKGGTE